MNKKIALGIVVLVVLVVVVIGIVNLNSPSSVTDNAVKTINTGNVKEFSMESFTEVIDGQYFPQFSIKDITVNKGDLVRFVINTKSGTHNINIDEFNVHAETPTGEITVVEFVADKTGEFEYYCSKPRHRELGHWGTLKVIE